MMSFKKDFTWYKLFDVNKSVNVSRSVGRRIVLMLEKKFQRFRTLYLPSFIKKGIQYIRLMFTLGGTNGEIIPLNIVFLRDICVLHWGIPTKLYTFVRGWG